MNINNNNNNKRLCTVSILVHSFTSSSTGLQLHSCITLVLSKLASLASDHEYFDHDGRGLASNTTMSNTDHVSNNQ